MSAGEVQAPEHAYDPTSGPLIWPQCATCHATFELRRGLSLSSGSGWFWYRGCKHKAGDVEMHTAEGRLP